MSTHVHLSRSLLLAAAALVATAGISRVAVADGGFPACYGYGAGYGQAHGPLTGSSFFEMPYATGRIPTPPYFALHPPVYYSAPVPRTYGYSPFAYPGSVPTPEIVEPTGPATIVNPYAKPSKSDSSTEESSDRVANHLHKDKVADIRNPYVGSPVALVATE